MFEHVPQASVPQASERHPASGKRSRSLRSRFVAELELSYYFNCIFQLKNHILPFQFRHQFINQAFHKSLIYYPERVQYAHNDI